MRDCSIKEIGLVRHSFGESGFKRHWARLLFRFATVFGAQDAEERIKEERKNHQPA
jgi:hypothetical protein